MIKPTIVVLAILSAFLESCENEPEKSSVDSCSFAPEPSTPKQRRQLETASLDYITAANIRLIDSLKFGIIRSVGKDPQHLIKNYPNLHDRNPLRPAQLDLSKLDYDGTTNYVAYETERGKELRESIDDYFKVTDGKPYDDERWRRTLAKDYDVAAMIAALSAMQRDVLSQRVSAIKAIRDKSESK